MPTYDYFCPANGETLEVRHGLRETLLTWGDLCAQLGLSAGATPADSPVQRLATGGQVVHAGSLKNPAAPPCGMGGCGRSACGWSG